MILLITATSLGLNIWGSVLMRQEFNPLWFIPKSTYLAQYFDTLDNYYPNTGELATVYVKTSNLYEHMDHLDGLISSLRNETELIGSVDDWFGGFKDLVSKRYSIGNSFSHGFFILFKLRAGSTFRCGVE